MKLNPCPLCGGPVNTKIVCKRYDRERDSLELDVFCVNCGLHCESIISQEITFEEFESCLVSIQNKWNHRVGSDQDV